MRLCTTVAMGRVIWVWGGGGGGSKGTPLIITLIVSICRFHWVLVLYSVCAQDLLHRED